MDEAQEPGSKEPHEEAEASTVSLPYRTCAEAPETRYEREATKTLTDEQNQLDAQAQLEQLDAERRAALLNCDISHLEPEVQAALRAALAEIKVFEEQRERDLARLGTQDDAIVR